MSSYNPENIVPGQSGPRPIPPAQQQAAPPPDIYGELERLRNAANNNNGIQAYHAAVYGSGLDQAEKDQLASMLQYGQFNSGGGGGEAPRGGGNSGGGGAPPPPGSGINRPGGLPGSNPANNYSDPNWIMSQIADRGLNSQNNPLYQQIQRHNTNLLNPTQGSPSGGTNPVLDDLYRRLGGVNFDQPIDLLTQFLGVGADGSYGGGGGGGGNGNSRSNAGRAQRRADLEATGQYSFAGGGGTGNGGEVPDTVGGKNTFFAEQIRKFFDPSRLDPANDPTMQPYLDALKQQVTEQQQDLFGKMSARAEGSGRYGGSLYGKWIRDAGDAAATDVANASANALFGSRQNALAQQMEALGLTNTRDLAAMQDATQRYGIDASSSASGASAAAQAELARRGQDLDAITALMGYQQGGLGSLQRLGEFNGNMQGNASNALGSLFGLEQAGWGQAANAANWMGQNYWQGQEFDFQKQQADWQRRQAEAADAFGREQWDWERGWADMFNEDQLMQNWLKGIGAIGGMGGSGSGSTTNPGAGINENAAAIAGGLGGGLYGYGLQRNR